ncbi:MAG: bifunctional homocysteine S-methyltransferase/methylenetetrahydrofolate reductase [Acidobacteriota bacterium]
MAVIPIPRSTPGGAKPKNPHAATLNFPRVAPPNPANEHTADEMEQPVFAATDDAGSNVASPVQEQFAAPQDRAEAGDVKAPMAPPVIRRSLPVVTRSVEFREAFPLQTWLMDGAMATMLFAKGTPSHTCVDELNLILPARVRDIHREYLAAGAQIVSTNTFGANRIRLSASGLASKMVAINQAGVRIARQAALDAGTGAYVAGVIGPLGTSLDPMGSITAAEAEQVFHDQAVALNGVDLFVLETFRDLKELRAAANAVRAAAGSYVVLVAQVSVEADGTLGHGMAPETWTRDLDALATEVGIDAIGVNCSVGPFATVAAIRLLASVTAKPMIASPSAGQPLVVDGRLQYPCSVEYFAAQTRRLLEAGAKMIGGCCGTTPDYVRQMRTVLDGFNLDGFDGFVEPKRTILLASDTVERVASAASVPMKEKSKLGAKLAAGKFVTLVEFDAPRSHEVDKLVAAGKQCKKASIDAISIPVGSRVHSRVPAPAALHLIQTGAGIETVLYTTARENNARGIESRMGEANALGLHNIVCFSGEGSPGSEMDSIRAVRIANNMNRGVDIAGNRFDPPTKLLLGVGVNLLGLDPSEDSSTERKRFEAKVQAGAEYAIAQPAFDRDLLETCLRHAEQFGIPVIASVLPLTSAAQADYVRNELLIPVPDSILRRLADAGDRAAVVGIEIACEQVAYLRGLAAGVRVLAAGLDAATAVRIATAKD